MNPRALLILCEGKTEELYFRSVIRHKRVNKVLSRVEVIGCQGQHRALVRRCVGARKSLARELGPGISENDIEVWAVCDRDAMREKYQKLLNYAKSKGVNLAFSDPQFETYLIQHFELKKTTNKSGELLAELEGYLGEEYKKGELGWFDGMVDQNPAVLDFAISNAEQLGNHTKPPFLTVQKLTRRLIEFAR